jgi:hypothetical protein
LSGVRRRRYTFFLFADLATDLYLKRLVRDYVHYDARVFCAAARIRQRLDADAASLRRLGQARGGAAEGAARNGTVRSGGGVAGAWSAWHVRHGELQYTNVQVGSLQGNAPSFRECTASLFFFHEKRIAFSHALFGPCFFEFSCVGLQRSISP